MKLINFDEYKILDTSDGMKLESWNGIKLLRPDPQIIWSDKDKSIPDRWQIHYDDLTFNLKLMGFKHTGLFPEQAYNWSMLKSKIKGKKDVKVLNLFAYTGAASVACLFAGASVVHVDSSRGMVDWAKENVESSNLSDKPIRFIVDDVVKFVEREIRRGNKYDIILMDPPSFGRGPKGETWKIEENIYDFVRLCSKVLSDNPLFVLINSYTTGLQPTVMANILNATITGGKTESYEVGLPTQEKGIILPCGCSALKTFNK